MAGVKRALISVSDKTGIVEMAKGIGRARSRNSFDRRYGESVARGRRGRHGCRGLYGSPEILDGRVKTLHPKIHGGLLGRRKEPKHVAEMQQHGIGPSMSSSSTSIPLKRRFQNPTVRSKRRLKISISAGRRCCGLPPRIMTTCWSIVDPADYARALEALKAGAVARVIASRIRHESLSTYRSLR